MLADTLSTAPIVSSPSLPHPLSVIAPTFSARKADEWRFVLSSSGLEADVVRMPDGRFGVRVATKDVPRAVDTLRTYETENEPSKQPRARDRAMYDASPWWAAGLVALLVAFYSLTGPAALGGRYFQAGTADAHAILGGAPWKAVTALTLHSDSAHVLGNALFGGILFAAVHKRLGVGLGTLTVVTAGALGNVMNAVHHRGVHLSIGASTAVLAAIGVLASVQLVRNGLLKTGARGFVAPLLGAAMLLGTIGASPKSDLFAHLYGLFAGLFVGLLVAVPQERLGRRLPEWGQAVAGGLAFALVLGSWRLALSA